MKSKTRRTIEKWVKTNVKEPVYIAEGLVFLYPASSVGVDHYLVTWMQRQTPKRVFEEFACSCRGFYNSESDDCKHIKDLKRQIGEGLGGRK